MKITKKIKERRKQTIDHLNRIQGQIETLKKYLEEDRCCGEIAQLTTSIAKSFDSLRAKTLEGFILNEFSYGKKVPEEKKEKLKRIINLYKK
jgi:DNA-binding FrmR family transcriptional regulator